MSNVDTSPLGIERTERIAGDEALNSRLDNVAGSLQNTQDSVTTEVLHRSEGDILIQRILEGYIQDLLDGKAEELERYLDFQNSQNLNYEDVRDFVGNIRASLAEEIRNLTDTLLTNLRDNDVRYNKLVSDVGRYLDILSDITLDSNQITLDDGELRAGAWTILSQARQWDLDIINRLNGLSASVGDSLKDAVEEIQNQLPSTEETISKAIEELSKSPQIKELSDALSSAIEDLTSLDVALVKEQADRQRELAELAAQQADALANEKALLLDRLATESQERVDAILREATIRQQLLLDEAAVRQQALLDEAAERTAEVNAEVVARKEAIDELAEQMLTRADLDKAEFQSGMLTVTNRIKNAEDGLTSEIRHRKDGDASTLNALNVYKVSNDSAITGLSTSLSNNVTKTNANTTLINGLTARMTTAEGDIENATTTAADAMTKATTAVAANSALSIRVDALAASITEGDGTEVDVNAFNALKAEVTSVQGTVTSLTEDVTTLESNYTSVNNKVNSHGTSISTLNNKMTAAENSISQSANDITLLKTDITSINSSLLTKVDSQAFSQLSSDVSELEGNYTTQAGLVTDLRGSLDTTNVNVSNAATAAQNAMNTAGSKGKVFFQNTAPPVAERLSQNLWIDTTGGNNTPKRWNGSAWVMVTDKVATDALAAANAATTLANTKADASAFNALTTRVASTENTNISQGTAITTLQNTVNHSTTGLATKASTSALNVTKSDVTRIDGTVSGHTNQLTQLTSDIDSINGTLATKANASALNDIYTKSQTDAKALEVAAGEVSKYNASLSIGIDNLLPTQIDLWEDGYWNTSNGVATSGSSYSRTKADVKIPVVAGEKYSLRSNTRTVLVFYSAANARTGHHESGTSVPPTTAQVITIPANTTYARANLFGASGVVVKPNPFDQSALTSLQGMLVRGEHTKLVWQPSALGYNSKIDANASAIVFTNSEVTRINGEVTSQASSISNLQSDLVTTDSKANTAINNAATAQQTANTAVTAGQANASNLTKLESTVSTTSERIIANGSQATLNVIGAPAANALLEPVSGSMTGSVIKLKGQVHSVVTASKMLIDPNKLYKLSVRYRRTSGDANRIYIAVVNYNAAGDRTVTSSNNLNPVGTPISSAIYPISNELPAINVWREATFYFKGKSTGASSGGWTTTSPRTFPALAATVDIGVLANYNTGNNLSQEYEIDYLIFEDATNEAANGINATAIQALDTKVTTVEGKATANSESITGLTSRLDTAENQIALKANASALQSYYTKNEADTKAATIAAGEVSKYNASLKIGSKNLLTATKWKTPVLSSVNKANGYEFTLADTESPYTGAWGMYGPWTELEAGTQYVFSFKIKALNSTPLTIGGHITGITSTGADAVYLDGVKVEGTSFSGGTPVVIPNDGKYHLVVVLMTKNTTVADHLYIQPNRLTSYTQPYNCSVKEVMLAEGNAYSQWVEPDEFIQEQIDANATAIDNTNSEVRRVDGRVTTEADRITSLTGRVDTVEGQVAKKADASALNSIYTKTETDDKATEIAAGEINKYDASLVIGGVNQIVNSEAARTSAASSNREYLMYESSAHLKQFYDDNLGKDITVSFEIMVPVAGTINVYSSNGSAHTFSVNTPWIAADTWTKVAVTAKPVKHATRPDHPVSTLEFYGIYGTGRIPTVRKVQLEAGNKATAWSPSPRDVQSALDVNASAISTTNSEVSRINEVVKGNVSDISNLKIGVAGKADVGALNALTIRVEDEERKTSTQAQSITDLTASLSNTDTIAKNALPQVTGGSNLKSFKDVLSVYTATTSNANNIVIETPITFTARMFKIMITGFNYTNTKSVIECNVSGYAYSGTSYVNTSATDLGTFSVRMRLGVKDGKVCVILSPKGTNWSYPQFSVSANIGHTTPPDSWKGGWSSIFKTEAELATYGVTNIIEPSVLDVSGELSTKASASAVSTLSIKVNDIDGLVTSQANQITTLTSDNNNNKNALTVQGKVIDGVKANYMVKMETNGVLAGFGLIQSSGAMGTVTSTFGVNANNFFIGAPSGGKKPFVVTTANQVVNGVTYPAGTWIDVAMIANATIGTAKIDDLAVKTAKIDNGAITTAKIGDLQVETLKIKDWAVTKPFIYTDTTSMSGSTYTIVNSNWVERLTVTASGFSPGSLVLVSLNSNLYITNREANPNSGAYMSDAPRIAVSINGVQTTLLCPRDEVIRLLNSYGSYNLYVGESSSSIPATLMYTAYANANGQVKASLLTRDGTGNNKSGVWGWVSHSKTTWLMQEFKK